MSGVRHCKGLALAVVWLALLGAGGCSLLGGDSKPKPAPLPANVASLAVQQVWYSKIGSVAGLQLSPHVHDSTVTLADSSGAVVALDVRTGSEQWRTHVHTPLASGVGSDGRWTAVTSQGSQLLVLENGQEIWRRPLPALAYTAPLVAGARVFVLTADRSLSAFDAATGTPLWSQQRAGDPLILRQSGALLAVENTLVAGVSGRLLGLNPDNGSVRWEAALANPRGTNDVERLVELVGPVSRVGSNVCARAFQANVGCVDAQRGQPTWTQAAKGSTGVTGDDSWLYGTESNGVLLAWRRADGGRAWTSQLLQHRQLTAPLLFGNALVLGDDSGLLHVLSPTDGAPLNRLTTDGSPIVTAPILAKDTLVVVTRNGSVYGFRLSVDGAGGS